MDSNLDSGFQFYKIHFFYNTSRGLYLNYLHENFTSLKIIINQHSTTEQLTYNSNMHVYDLLIPLQSLKCARIVQNSSKLKKKIKEWVS